MIMVLQLYDRHILLKPSHQDLIPSIICSSLEDHIAVESCLRDNALCHFCMSSITFCLELFSQDCLYSKQPWKVQTGLPLGKRTDVISDQDDKENVFLWNNDGTVLPVSLLKELGFYVQHSSAVIHTHCIWSVYLCLLHISTVELGKRVYGNPMQTGSSRTLLCHE